MDAPIEIRKPIEVNLADFRIDQLQMIQQQLNVELRNRELATYKQNVQLKQKNAALTTSYQKKEGELRKYEERDQELSQVLQSIALEIPQCNIEFALPVPQKLRKVADRAKALEETVAQLEETLANRE